MSFIPRPSGIYISTYQSAGASAGGTAASVAPPSGVISADGLTLTLTFAEAVTIGAGGSGGFYVRGVVPANAAVAANYDSGDTTDTLVLTLESPFYATEVARLYHDAPGNGIENADGDDLLSFTNLAITNNSEVGDGILRDSLGRPVRDGNGRATPYTIP